MRADKLTTKFQQALADAQSLALGADNQFIEPAHLLSALLDQDGSVVTQLLQNTGVTVGRVRASAAPATGTSTTSRSPWQSTATPPPPGARSVTAPRST